LAQLSSVLEGSVVIGGEAEAPDVVPIASDAMPTVKGLPEDPLVRLENAPRLSGRYAPLSVGAVAATEHRHQTAAVVQCAEPQAEAARSQLRRRQVAVAYGDERTRCQGAA